MLGHILKIATVLIMLTVLPATPAPAQLVDSFISKGLSARLEIIHFGECGTHEATVSLGEFFQREHGEKKISSPGGFIFIRMFNGCTEQEFLMSQDFSLSGDEFTLNKHRATLNTTLTLSNIAGCRVEPCSGVPTNVVVDIEWRPTGSLIKDKLTFRSVGFGVETTEKLDGVSVGAIASGSLIAGGIDFIDLVGGSVGGGEFPFFNAVITQGRSHIIVKTDR